MPNSKPPTRWARELDEDDLRRAREKGPGGVTYVTPPQDGIAIMYVLLSIATGAMGFLLGFASRAIYDLVLTVL